MATEENTPTLDQEEGDSAAKQSNVEEDSKTIEKETDATETMNGFITNSGIDNGNHDCPTSHDESHEQLSQMVVELNLQNEYLKAHIDDLRSELVKSKEHANQEREGGVAFASSGQENGLTEEIKRLKKEIEEKKQTQEAAEDALEHLRSANSEADGKVKELSGKLNEAQQKMEQEIKERDEKYVDLETKFQRLHKRAKQKIQELQKEKDDLEAHLSDLNAKVEQASAQQALAQQELERSRQQANDALKSMDAEREQLRAANNKLRDTFDEMRRSLTAKETTIEGLQQSVFEKEQMLEQVRGLLHTAEEKRQLFISELSAKHQKQIESLEAQLTDALADRNKVAETISFLQVSLAEKDTKIADLEAASTVRLGAAMEELRGEINHIKDQHDKERQNWEASCQALRVKLEASENACLRSEFGLAKLRSQLELELSTKSQLLNAKDVEILAANDEISRLENEFSAYKVRAHALLQKKDAELSAARSSEVLKAHEEALNEAEKELTAAFAERDKALQDLHVALKDHEREITGRDAALNDAEQRLRSITMQQDSTTALYLSEKETWGEILESLEESWRSKYATLEAQKVEHVVNDAEKELDMLKLHYEKLKNEHDSFRDIADRTIEEKEKEINKLLDENRNLYHSLESRAHDDHAEQKSSASLKEDDQVSSIAAAEQQILLLAKQQAQREEELSQSQRHILALQEEIEELEHENRLHSQQETMLKEELRNMERSQKREGLDMTYLKNVVLKLLETGEVEALLPVIATLLQFSPEESKKCQQVYQSGDGVSSQTASYSDASSTPQSLFSRFYFG